MRRTCQLWLPNLFLFLWQLLSLGLSQIAKLFFRHRFGHFLDAPFKLDFFCSPRLAAKAAPAAICCFLERAGITLYRFAGGGWLHPVAARK